MQFHRVVGVTALTRLLLREIIKPPQFNKTMTTKLFEHYRSIAYINFENFQNFPLCLAHVPVNAIDFSIA